MTTKVPQTDFRPETNHTQLVGSDDYNLIFQAIMDHSKDGLFVTDHLGNVVMVNHACEEMNNFNASDVLGRNVRDLVAAGYYEQSATLKVIEQKTIVSLITATGQNRKVLSTAIPIFDENNDIKFILVNDRDVTFINQATDLLEESLADTTQCRFEFSELGTALSELQEIVVKSPGMQEVMYMAARAAKFDLPLLITGDTGVGKNSIVKLIHQLSSRKEGPFTTVNCASIADSLLESELFGYEKGAFTGARAEGKEGMFEVAHNGTLFLDEIGEIPLGLQAKLLRFIESGELLRIGSVKSKKINTRIIAATHQNLEAMVEQGRFRRDLYFRLNVIPIHIPRLSERKAEIPSLVSFFLKRFNAEFNSEKTISKAALNAMVQYQYPGNVRELENLLKRLVTMTESEVIRVGDLPPHLVKTDVVDDGSIQIWEEDYLEEVNQFEIDRLSAAIKKFGSQRKAAKALGISQSTISRKLKIR